MNDKKTPPDWAVIEAAKRCAWLPGKTLAQMRGHLAVSGAFNALCHAIEQHEAFRQEVSDEITHRWPRGRAPDGFARFIITKRDPLAAALAEGAADVDKFLEALAERGGKIVWEG